MSIGIADNDSAATRAVAPIKKAPLFENSNPLLHLLKSILTLGIRRTVGGELDDWRNHFTF